MMNDFERFRERWLWELARNNDEPLVALDRRLGCGVRPLIAETLNVLRRFFKGGRR